MIPPAPADFWKQVIDRFAELIWERERKTGGERETALSAGVRLPGMGPVPMMTNSERAAMQSRVAGTMPPPAPTEAAE